MPGTEEFAVRFGARKDGGRSTWGGGAVKKEDKITRFLREVAATGVEGLAARLRPDKRSRWASVVGGYRYYHVWYSRPLWEN